MQVGISHDPVIPMIRGAGPELRDQLIGKSPFGPAEQARREVVVRETPALAKTGKGPSRPLNPAWNRAFLECLSGGDLAITDAFAAEGS